MLTIRTTDHTPLVVDISAPHPSIYLDYGVVAGLARDASRGGEVRERLLDRGGTFLWSWAHLAELCGLGKGPTYDRIVEYLDGFGEAFAIIEVIPQLVIERERTWHPGQLRPVIDEVLTKQLVRDWDGLRPITLALAADALSGAPGLQVELQELQRKHKTSISTMVNDARSRYRSNRTERANVDGIAAAPGGGSRTNQVYVRLVNECIRTNEAFVESDGFDLLHATVSTAWADAVVLDRKWARRVRNLHLGMATVFDTTEIQELVAWLGSVAPLKHPAKRIKEVP